MVGDALRRAVGQEVAARDHEQEHGRRQRQAGQGLRAEVTDDRGVDQDVERLDRQRAERRQGHRHDATVVLVGEQRHPVDGIRAGDGYHPPSACREGWSA